MVFSLEHFDHQRPICIYDVERDLASALGFRRREADVACESRFDHRCLVSLAAIDRTGLAWPGIAGGPLAGPLCRYVDLLGDRARLRRSIIGQSLNSERGSHADY